MGREEHGALDYNLLEKQRGRPYQAFFKRLIPEFLYSPLVLFFSASVPALDNLRNFFLRSTTEMLSYSERASNPCAIPLWLVHVNAILSSHFLARWNSILRISVRARTFAAAIFSFLKLHVVCPQREVRGEKISQDLQD